MSATAGRFFPVITEQSARCATQETPHPVGDEQTTLFPVDAQFGPVQRVRSLTGDVREQGAGERHDPDSVADFDPLHGSVDRRVDVQVVVQEVRGVRVQFGSVAVDLGVGQGVIDM
ncbi:hypothetical protein [Rhodococcus marinonascens]|uniref:hypothetical protein n=1 Tax=Rhodococcus marinonascens TaxID=38311 RepID=UPI000932C627|nr:hypothetical protein [Rhodococcus marinonascens]